MTASVRTFKHKHYRRNKSVNKTRKLPNRNTPRHRINKLYRKPVTENSDPFNQNVSHAVNKKRGRNSSLFKFSVKSLAHIIKHCIPSSIIPCRRRRLYVVKLSLRGNKFSQTASRAKRNRSCVLKKSVADIPLQYI